MLPATSLYISLLTTFLISNYWLWIKITPFVHYGLIHYILYEIVAQEAREAGKAHFTELSLVLFVYKKK